MKKKKVYHIFTDHILCGCSGTTHSVTDYPKDAEILDKDSRICLKCKRIFEKKTNEVVK